MIDLKKNKLSVYVPTGESRMLEDICTTYNRNTSSVIAKAIELIYPQAMLKIKFTEWALCAMVNNRFDLLRFRPAESDGFICIGTDFVELPDKEGNTQLVGVFGSTEQEVIDNQPVVKTWTEYKNMLDSVTKGVDVKAYIVHMYDSRTNSVRTESCTDISEARRVAHEFYTENLVNHPDASESTFVDNIRHKDVYSLKFDSGVVTASIIPV